MIGVVLSLQSCATVQEVQIGEDISRVDFAAVVAKFPEYKNTGLPQDITPLTQQNILAETKRIRNAALLSPKPATVEDASYRVGINDVLHIVVWDHPELSYSETNNASEELSGSVVTANGTIFYPYIGTVEVLGLTVEKIRIKLTKLLSATIEKPQLEVKKPGMQKISDIPLTLLDAINIADGVTDMADLDSATLTRQDQVYKINLSELFVSGNKELNIKLLDGDVLTIPNISESKYYVLGHVANPIHKEMSNIGKNLFDAIEEAGGVKPVNEDSLHPPINYFVVRGTDNGTLVFHLDQKAADSLIVMNNFQIMADDIVYVASERRSKWNLVYKQIVQYTNLFNKKNTP